MRQAQAKRQQNISFRRLRHKTKKSCDPVLTTDSKRRLPAPLSELLHKMKSTQLFKDSISESWGKSNRSAAKHKNDCFLRCPPCIAAIPARLHPSSLPFSAACSSSATQYTTLQSQNPTAIPDRIGLSRQNRSLLAGSAFPANPPLVKSTSSKATSHKTIFNKTSSCNPLPKNQFPQNQRVAFKATLTKPLPTKSLPEKSSSLI